MASDSNSIVCRGLAVLEVSVPLRDVTLWDIPAVAWSFVPWVFSVYLIGRAVCGTRYSVRISALLLVIMITVNEFGTKRLVESPRPVGSCLTSFGMPSSHSMLSIGMLVYWTLELFLGHSQLNGFRIRTTRQRIKQTLKWLSLLAPVPASRVYLGDHSMTQVVAGSAVGAAMALTFFIAHTTVSRRKHRRLSSSS